MIRSSETGKVNIRNQGRLFRIAMSPEKEEEKPDRGGRTTGRDDEMKQNYVKQKSVKL